VHEAGPVEAGDVIIRLDERPMVIVAGEVPAFRPLDVGTRGRDVAALNAFLADRGYDVDPESATFDSATRSAVTDWQEDLDMQPTGMVELGDILFLARDQLGGPAFRIAPGVNVGASLSAGTPFLQQLASSPTVSVEFGAMTPDELRPGITGTLAFPTGETVPVGLGEITLDEGRSILELTAPDGGSVCAPSECSRLVDAQSDVRLTVEFTLVPETEGPILPAAAIQTGADGDPFVYLADGRRINVEIIVVSGGLVVVDGVEEGAEVALP
jgi:peptidoglycan hydrolase-like protein with peptidoglycan-binding domain